MRKTLIAITAASALLLGLSASAFATGCGTNCFNRHVNVGSSVFNIGGQENGRQSVSGVLNEESVTGNGATGIYNNASPLLTF